MASSSINNKAKARLYAQAIIDSAMQVGDEDLLYQVGCELNIIEKAFLADSSLARVVHSQVKAISTFSKAQARKIIANTFEGISMVIQDVLVVMLMNLDFKIIIHVIDAFSSILYKDYNIIIAEVYTVVSLDDRLRKIITKKLTDDFGKKIYLQENIDKSILGGIVINAHGRILDCSVSSKVKHIKSDLLRFKMAN